MRAIELALKLKAQAITVAKERAALHTEAYKLNSVVGQKAALKAGLSTDDIREIKAEAKQDYVKVGIAVGAAFLTSLVD